jgi:ribosome-binding protein aMBF1 (putative translation factor)
MKRSKAAAIAEDKIAATPRGRPKKNIDITRFSGRVGEIIRQRRLELKMSQTDVAFATDNYITAAMVSMYEVGESEPRMSKLVALAAALRMDLGEFVPPEIRRVMANGANRGELIRLLSGSWGKG